MQFLKYNTASQNIMLGPFVASADGNTQQTGLTIANTDIKLYKEGGSTLGSANLSGTHIASGVYFTTLNTTDTNTLGKMTAYVHISPALPVWKDFMVLPGVVYDSLVSGSDFLQVDSHQASGTSIGSFLDVATSSRLAATATGIGNLDVLVSSRLAGTATGIGNLDVLVSSRLAGTATGIGYLDAAITSRSSFNPGTQYVSAIHATATYLATGASAQVGDYVWDAVLADHLDSGTTGNALNAAGAAGDPWSTAVPGAYGAGTAGNILGNRLDVGISSRLASTATGIGFLDVALSSRTAATATGLGNLGNLDVLISSRLAGTATGIGFLDAAISSRSAFDPGASYVSAVHATATLVSDKTGYTIAAGGIPVGGFAAGAVTDAAVAADAETAIANAVKAIVVEAEGSITLQQAQSIILSVVAGVTTASGATFKTSDGAATRVQSTLDANNQRTAITLTPSA